MYIRAIHTYTNIYELCQRDPIRTSTYVYVLYGLYVHCLSYTCNTYIYVRTRKYTFNIRTYTDYTEYTYKAFLYEQYVQIRTYTEYTYVYKPGLSYTYMIQLEKIQNIRTLYVRIRTIYVRVRIRTYISIPSVCVRISPVYTRTPNYVSEIYVRIWHKFEKAVYILPNGGYRR